MYRSTFFLFLSAIVSFTSAIQFLNPAAGTTVSRGANVQLTWTSVDTDPTSFSVYLWNFKYYPPFYTYIKTVNTADHATTVTIPCDVISQDGYQFNAISGNNVYVIYAQSPLFSIDSTTCSSPIVGSNPEGCKAQSGGRAAQTVTVTAAATTITAAATTITAPASTVTVARRTATVALTTVTSIVQAQCPPCYGSRV